MGPMGDFMDQIGVQRGGLSACRRLVAVQHAIDLAPRFALRKGTRDGCKGGLNTYVATLQSLKLLCQRVQVEIVLDARPPGFQRYRKVLLCSNGFHQFLGSNPTEPEG